MWVVVWSFGRLFVCCHVRYSSDVTLAFEDAQGIQHFSREKTDNTDDTDALLPLLKKTLNLKKETQKRPIFFLLLKKRPKRDL